VNYANPKVFRHNSMPSTDYLMCTNPQLLSINKWIKMISNTTNLA
jgi:hypothetical protein